MQYKKLFTPGKIGNVEIKNRIVMPPMMLGFGQMDGTPTKEMMDYYEERAIGGWGFVVDEITPVHDFIGALSLSQPAIKPYFSILPPQKMIFPLYPDRAKIFI